MIPTIGRIVIYRLTVKDSDVINQQRTFSPSIDECIKMGEWPRSARPHIGEPAHPGQEFPMLIVHVSETATAIRGQVFLDGNDVLWMSAEHGFEDGKWRWPGEPYLGEQVGHERKNCF